MKLNNTCVKCGSDSIRRVSGKTSKRDSRKILRISIWKAIIVDSFVCTECGFIEQWIAKPEDLDYLAKKADKPDDVSDFV